MASNFPSSLDSFTNPSSSDAMDSVSVPHASQHSDLNDAVEALQAKVGADSSAVTSSLDYKVAQLESDVAGFTSGKILQVVTATYATEETTTSTTYSATSLTATITPTSASSTILIQLAIPWRGSRPSNQYSGVGYFAIYRGATQLTDQYLGQTKDGGTSIDHWLHVHHAAIHMDSPATTSATTYTVYHRTSTGQTLETFTDNAVGTIMLMEVAA